MSFLQPFPVEVTSHLEAVQQTETKMVEMSALNHLISTHVLQQAQQIELLYEQVYASPLRSVSRFCEGVSARRIEMVKGRQGERVRLYVRGTVLGYKRSKSNQYPNTSLVQIEGVNTKEEVAWYAGKRMAYIYKAKVKRDGSHYRCIWGKVTRPHGNSGVVRAKFKSNLPPKELGYGFSCIPAISELLGIFVAGREDFCSQLIRTFVSVGVFHQFALHLVE
uniref:Uncharacterized protein n=1 Tax=Salix viminalis TaxID=40686 RepID=A0A6N2M6W8_SALVM